jgi:N-acetylglucosaminyl-diphospho-decaprenol L-rhamnosyltransferase
MPPQDAGLPSDGTSVDVSVIVVTFNNEAIISRCLEAIRQSVRTHVAEVLVVDNSSTDGTVQVVTENARGATVIPLERNVGFAVANNVALERARGRYVALVNSDAFPDPGAIDRLIHRADCDPKIGLVGARLRYASGRWQPSAGCFPSLRNDLGVALLLHRVPITSRLRLSVLADPAHYTRAHRVDWVSGAFCLARPSVGPLPTAGFMYGEDVEWAHQAGERGYETWIEPCATAVHLGGGATGSVVAAQMRQRRRIEFELRWFGSRGRWPTVGARLIMALHAVIRIGLYVAILPVRPRSASAGIAEFGALLRGAARPPIDAT